ncbi:MAG TPA: hypothetical protein VIC85_14245 [Ktedonobacterales bacterium]|jgi:cytochrome c biogenesis protein CcdA
MDNLNSWLGFFDVLGPWGRYVAGFLLFLLVVLAVFGAFTPFVQRNRRWLSLILGGGLVILGGYWIYGSFGPFWSAIQTHTHTSNLAPLAWLLAGLIAVAMGVFFAIEGDRWSPR